MEGKTIKKVRQMTEQEMNAEGWDRPTTAIEFTDGTVLYPSQDDEGNGPGTFFMVTSEGKQVYLFAKEE